MIIKERILGAIEILDEDSLTELFEYIKNSFVLKKKTWDDIPEDDPSDDEIKAFEKYSASRQ